jgi:putative transposase
MRAVARQFRVPLATVQYWVRRAEGQRLDRVDWDDRPRAPRRSRRTDAALEDRILDLRRQLREHSDLGAFGAVAIHEALQQQGVTPLPAVRTIGRILQRRGALDGRRRTRRPPPPVGWYLPDLAKGRAELDSFDLVEGLVIQDGPHVEVLNGVSLHGGLVVSWPREASVTAKQVSAALVEHWQAVGLPGYAQFDNDTLFHGPQRYPDTLGRVIRLCLSLGVVPVFVPPRETGFQAMIESYNGWWQAKVWARFHHAALTDLQERSGRHVAALRQRRAARIEAAPPRRPFPEGWRLDLQAQPTGRLVYLRRTDGQGRVEVLGHTLPVDGRWPHRLVRVEVELGRGRMRFYALRRREPAAQPLLGEVPYQLPERRFQE